MTGPRALPARPAGTGRCVPRELRRQRPVEVPDGGIGHDAFDYESLPLWARYLFDTRNRCQGSTVERL
jgi:hypothetical protein